MPSARKKTWGRGVFGLPLWGLREAIPLLVSRRSGDAWDDSYLAPGEIRRDNGVSGLSWLQFGASTA